jgi:hypothetical protein
VEGVVKGELVEWESCMLPLLMPVDEGQLEPCSAFYAGTALPSTGVAVQLRLKNSLRVS